MMMTEQMEEWKIIEENQNYMVSNMGRIKSLDHYVPCYSGKGKRLVKGKIFIGATNVYGYRLARININGKEKQIFIHRAVAKAFIPNPLNKPQVNHINGNKLDNRVENLEWATSQENNAHAFRKGLNTMERCKKPILKIKNGIVVARYDSVKQAGEKENLSHCAICWRLKQDHAVKEYEWRYEK